MTNKPLKNDLLIIVDNRIKIESHTYFFLPINLQNLFNRREK